MSRPRRKRCICFWPKATYFKPAGIPLNTIEEINLSGDEIEAIRLKDLHQLDQIEVAKKMHISRPTVVRILQSARKKIADFLVNSKALKLKQGNDIVFKKNFQHQKRRCGRHLHKVNLI
jgi:predicted DNA-binding protein (UPF0251 family)